MNQQSHIIHLPSDVVDQIAAGEVVERPAHMVKELIENSLDAGATEIVIQYSLGGRSVIVEDNGCGIKDGELAFALDRHATSKIKKTEDLWRLSTYGFRGEALASIAAVSQLTVSSRSKDQNQGASLISEFGRRGDVHAIQCPVGTKIIISDLFENVPARLKFLKSSAAEISQIKSVLKAMALSHPHVTMKVLGDGELVYYWPACASRLERVEQVLELKNLFEGEAMGEGVKAYSVFTDPHQVSKTNRQIWIFVQNRWVQDRSLQVAIIEAYRNLLMHGEYPYCVTWVEVDPQQVDVNIHPTKSQVKFMSPSSAFRAVQSSVRDHLVKAPWLKSVTQPQVTENVPLFDLSHQPTQYAKRDTSLPLPKQLEVTKIVNAPNVWSSLQILAQAHLTYIVTQSDQGLILIDQHAAHERYLFEKISDSFRQGHFEMQEFLFPLAIDLSPEKVEVLMECRSNLSKLGVEVEALGPSVIGIKSASTLFKETAIVRWLEPMAQAMIEQGGSHLLENKLNDSIATLACHSAIRAGDPLSREQMQVLLNQMDEFPLTSFCPHGRPVSLKYAWIEIEKGFGRIV